METFAGVELDEREARFDEDAGEVVRRCDLADLASPVRTSEGFLRAQGILTRAGVFEYHRTDGTVTRELRHPDEVFEAESLRSFALVPVTMRHPPDLLTPQTVREYQVGSVGMPEAKGEFARADVLLTDADAIRSAETGTNALSCGYTMRRIPRSGTYRDASGADHRFDAVQTRIRGNHVALCDSGRAGPNAFLRMDSGDAGPRNTTPKQSPAEPGAKKGPTMEEVEITIDGVTFKVPKQLAPRFDSLKQPEKKPEDKNVPDPELASVKSALEKAQGQIAALQSAESKRTDEASQKAKREGEAQATKQRLLTLGHAATVLGKSIDELVVMDDATIMREVVKKEAPDVKIEGRSDDFVRGIFETVTAKRTDTSAALNALIGAARDKTPALALAGETQKRIDDARSRMVKDLTESWRPKKTKIELATEGQ